MKAATLKAAFAKKHQTVFTASAAPTSGGFMLFKPPKKTLSLRAEFEKWAKREWPYSFLPRQQNGEYVFSDHRGAWLGYQAGHRAGARRRK
jgi:hypothetical protein